VRKDGEERVYTHVHLRDTFPVELTIYGSAMIPHIFKSSITGKPIERASLVQFEQILATEYPELSLSDALQDMDETPDRFQLYYALLLPLENVKQSPRYHPEGDVLYHSLQVFDLACDELPYDEDFLLAALLHDVGKAIDTSDHVAAGLEALEGFISARTHWLIEHHMLAHRIFDGTIGSRAHRRLRASESYEELVTLNRCDRGGRIAGVPTSELEDALEYIRQLSYNCE
jgi:predicted HD phosphohydrolase